MVELNDIALLQQLNVDTLERLSDVLQRIDQPNYTILNTKGNASVGQHVRHTLEFYQCLLGADDLVNYDLRKRDILIESSPDHALAVLREIQQQLHEVLENRSLQLVAEVSSKEASFQLPSSFARELFYVLEHAIHHMALIRVLIKDQQPDFEIADVFGVAYSTLAYRDQQVNG